MKQMNVDEPKKIEIDFEAEGLPKSVKIFEPVLFHEGKGYCCLLGPDLQKGILGYGQTEDDALCDWDINAKKRIKLNDPNDAVVQYMIDTLNTSVNDVW